MAKAQKKTAKIKVKKKRWFPIYSPAFLGKKKIGESYLTEANVAVGREMKISLRDLTGSVRDQNVYVSLKVKSVSGSDLETEGIGYNYVPFFIKKMVKRRGARADESFITRTKEGKLIRIKTLVSTTFKVPHSTCTDLRAIVREALVDFANKSNLDVFLENLLRNKFQIETKKRLSKICPVKDVLVRVVKLEPESQAKKAVTLKVKKEEEKSLPEETQNLEETENSVGQVKNEDSQPEPDNKDSQPEVEGQE